jgi:hypothetical protein
MTGWASSRRRTDDRGGEVGRQNLTEVLATDVWPRDHREHFPDTAAKPSPELTAVMPAPRAGIIMSQRMSYPDNLYQGEADTPQRSQSEILSITRPSHSPANHVARYCTGILTGAPEIQAAVT